MMVLSKQVEYSLLLPYLLIGSATSFTLHPTSLIQRSATSKPTRENNLSYLSVVTKDEDVEFTSTTSTTSTTTDANAGSNTGPFNFITKLFKNAPSIPQSLPIIPTAVRTTKAQDLMTRLVKEEECYSTESGAMAFIEACADGVIIEDCFEPEAIVGIEDVTTYMIEKAASRQGKGTVRMDKISDGDSACGFAWTWTTDSEEGLRGTTFAELDPVTDKISYIREITEPLFKPGDLTVEILKLATANATKKEPEPFVSSTPTDANEVAKYLFNEVQGQDVEEGMRFFSPSILYRDFNFEDILSGKDEVKKFIEDFSFPVIEFRTQKFDDGKLATCFTWEVVIMDSPQTTKGISFYELDPDTRLITYVRDVPEPAIKPPPLGKLARQLRPGLGYFQGVEIGSRQDGL